MKLHETTIKVFERNSDFHVKECTMGRSSIAIFQEILRVLTKFAGGGLSTRQ